MSVPKPATRAPTAAPRRDGTHLSARGSIEFGRIVAEELARVLPETATFLRKLH